MFSIGQVIRLGTTYYNVKGLEKASANREARVVLQVEHFKNRTCVVPERLLLAAVEGGAEVFDPA